MGIYAFYLNLLFTIMIGWTPPTYGARILFLTQQWKSHILKSQYIGEGLVEKGHQVYIVLSDKLPEQTFLKAKGLQVLKYHTPEDHKISSFPGATDRILTSVMAGNRSASLTAAGGIFHTECTDLDRDTRLLQKLQSLHLDLAIVNISPLSVCMVFMALKLKIPFIVSQYSIDMDMMRTASLPSFAPDSFLPYSQEMTFSERLFNSLSIMLINMRVTYPLESVLNVDLLNKYNEDPNVRTWKDLIRKAELFLVTQGPVLEYALPTAPNIIILECLTCKPATELCRDIESMMHSYKEVIVVSFGSQLDKLPNVVLQKLLESFKEMSEVLFIWRFKGEIPYNISTNIKLMTWIPQNELLAHPKTKLFITHSGNNGQHEAIYHGVPMLGFSVLEDQKHNAHRAMAHGYGLKVDIRDFTTTEITWKMNELLHNSTFRERTNKASKILKSAPMAAVEKAAFWTEHVLKFGGDHLKPHGLKMTWYSYYMIDIILFIQFVFLACSCLLYKIFRCISNWVKAQRLHNQEFMQDIV